MPQEMAAPSSKESSSGNETKVEAGTFMKGAWPPCPVMPYTVVPLRHSWDQPTRQCLQRPQPL